MMLATSTVSCAAMLSFNWSEHRGVTLGIDRERAERSTIAFGEGGWTVASTDPEVRAGVARDSSRRYHLASELR